MDEIYLWDRAITEEDILYWYNDGHGRGYIYEDLCFVEGRGVKCYQYNFDVDKLIDFYNKFWEFSRR